jgi:hypothetical protein
VTPPPSGAQVLCINTYFFDLRMPPKANKKKGKSSKPDATEVGPALVPPHDLEDQFQKLSMEWEISPQKEHLVGQVRHTILSQDHISIDNALCLGLGSMEMAQLKPLPGWPKVSHTFKDDISLDWQDATLSGEWDEKAFGPVAKGRKRNNSLYQLLVFETALSCLRRNHD